MNTRSFGFAFATVAMGVASYAGAGWTYVAGNPGTITDEDGNVLKAYAYASTGLNYEDWMEGKIYIGGFTTLTTGALDFSQTVADANGTEYEIGGIGRNAFDGSAVTSVVLAPSIRQIGYQCFRNCTSLTSVTIPEDSLLDNLGGVVYGYDGKNGTGQAFSGCTSLSGYLVVPETIKEILTQTFSSTALSGVYLPGVTNVMQQAFNNSSKNIVLEFGPGMRIFGKEVFYRGESGALFFRNLPAHGTADGDTTIYFDCNGNALLEKIMNHGTIYIPMNAEKTAPSDDWAAYVDAFVALKAGNTFTLPSYDSETGAWTDGSMYNKNANKTFTVKCWDPDGTTSAALLAY